MKNASFSRWLAVLATTACMHALPSQASCWHDPRVAQLAYAIALGGFPTAAGQMPEVLVCDAQHFDPNIGGDYTSGVHRIRLPTWQLQSGNLNPVIAHEMAHAEVALHLGAGVPVGHSRDFFAALLRAGYHAEAQRVARYVQGGQQEFLVALGATSSGPSLPPPNPPPHSRRQPPADAFPPQRWIQVCQPVTVAVWCRLPNGQVVIQHQIQNQCQLIPG